MDWALAKAGFRRWLRLKLRVARVAVPVTLAVLLTILLVRACEARKMAELDVWHRVALDQEFSHAMRNDVRTLDQYLAIEERLFAELDQRVHDVVQTYDQTHTVLNRYAPQSRCFAGNMPRDYNRTQVVLPEGGLESAVGGALLVHGLSDSPYSMRATAQTLQSQGYYVVSLRVPGHGTTPGSLSKVHFRDWLAAVELGARHVRDAVGEDRPMVMVGYSNGGALVLKQTLDAIKQSIGPRSGKNRPRADQVILFSPAIGVSRFAKAGSVHRLLSWTKTFEQFAWQSVTPEFDPFKYNSFPKNAGKQISDLCDRLRNQMTAIHAEGLADQLPPIVTFQSVVDSTVLFGKTLEFYDRLPRNGSELVVCDVNRGAYLTHFIDTRQTSLLDQTRARTDLPYRLTVIGNASASTLDTVKTTYGPGDAAQQTVALDTPWPAGVYSLSHVALPFPPSDPLYGKRRTEDQHPDWPNLPIGSIELWGERHLLSISADTMIRLRHNPFYDEFDRLLREHLPTP